MSDTTPNLRLPYIQSAQAQKHVTHNEAIRALDAMVQLSVTTRSLSAPPATPLEGQRFIVPNGATGAWAGFAPHIAAWQDGAWVKYTAREGWLAWTEDEDRLYAFDGAAWNEVAPRLNPTPLIGINATADPGNRLAVASAASLFTHAGSDHRHKINKATAGDTASLLYQTAFSGRAELGLCGDDNLRVKVSPDGVSWKDALVVDRTSGAVAMPFTTLATTSPWIGKKWTALGTSITQGGTYTTPLAALLGAVFTNLGVNGGRLSGPAGGGGLEIGAKIAQIASDADLVTLEAGINDFRTGVPLGAPTDTTSATFHGALYKAGIDILAANPQRVLVYLTPYANSEGSNPDWDTPNANGNTLAQFQQAVRDAGRRLGCPVIDVGGESGIGAQTASVYLADGLHPSPTGGLRMAQFIYDRLLFIRPTQLGVAMPAFSPGTGTYAATQSVTLTCATPGASIRYTTDGTTPTAASPLYSGPISVSATTTLKAFAQKPGLSDSGVATAIITIAAAFSPASLSPAVWYDASDLATLFQDTAAATPVSSDGQPVALIRDKSGNNRHLTQATLAARPLYKTSGGLAWLLFNGGAMPLAARYTTPSGNWAIAWATRKNDTQINGGMLWGVTGAANHWAGDNILGNQPDINAAGQQVDGAFGSNSATVDHVVVINVVGGALTMYQNGVAGVTASGITTLSGDGITFNDPSYIMKGRIYQLMLIPRALTTAEVASLTSWLKGKAGI